MMNKYKQFPLCPKFIQIEVNNQAVESRPKCREMENSKPESLCRALLNVLTSHFWSKGALLPGEYLSGVKDDHFFDLVAIEQSIENLFERGER